MCCKTVHRSTGMNSPCLSFPFQYSINCGAVTDKKDTKWNIKKPCTFNKSSHDTKLKLLYIKSPKGPTFPVMVQTSPVPPPEK